MKHLILLLALLLPYSAFSQKKSTVPPSARQAIAQANTTYDGRFRSNDPAFYKLRYTTDACILPDRLPTLCGRDAIRSYYFDQGKNRGLRLQARTTELSGGKSAVIEEGTYQLYDPQGQMLDQGKYISTWVRQDKVWKLRREIWNSDEPPAPEAAAVGYDSLLAHQLGADDYGMHRYFLVLLKTGPAQITEKATVDSLFAGHMSNIGRLAEQKKLVLAGPIGRKEKYRGLFVFAASSIEEVHTLTATDPAIQAGLLEPEIMPYYGSAALKLVNAWHERVQKKRF